jgi:hypothetical protein
MALITFVSKEKALEAKKDLNGFQIDEETLPMRLLTPAEYLYYQRWGRLKGNFCHFYHQIYIFQTYQNENYMHHSIRHCPHR